MDDILFGNNNQDILKRLAKADLNSHKLKTALTAIIIVMAICLIAVICTVLVNDAFAKVDSIPYHAQYHAVNEEVKDELLADADFEAVGIYKDFGSVIEDNGRTYLSYLDEMAMELLGFQFVNGRLPVDEREVLVSKTYLELRQLSVGDMFEFSYTDVLTNQLRDQQFTICGVIEHRVQEAGNQYYIVPSDRYRTMIAEQAGQMATSDFSTQTPANVDLLLCLNAERSKMSPEEQKEYLRAKGMSLGIERYDIVLNPGYIEVFFIDDSVIAAVVFFVVFLMFTSGFVIYSIFYISVTASMPMYAQLMSLGTTQKQLRHFVHIEGNILASRFIPLGMLLSLLLSILISKLVLVSGIKWLPYDIPIILLAGLLVFIAMKIALLKPAKLLASISPIEAMQLMGDAGQKKQRVLKRITPFSLAKNNLRINYKKNRMAVFSLSISGTIMIAFIMLLASINLPAMLRESYPLDEQFQIGIQMDNFYERFPQVVHNNPLSDDLEKEIDRLPGVTSIIREECIIGNLIDSKISYENPDHNEEVLNSLSPELLANVSEVVSGSITYEDLGTNGVIINKYRTDNSTLNYDVLQVGDTMLFQFDINGKVTEQSFEVVGIAYFPATELFYTRPEVINAISPYRNVSHLSVFCDSEHLDTVKRELQKLVSGNPNLRINSYAEDYAIMKGYIQIMMNALYGISVFVLIFGLLHMINILLSSAIMRKKEFALLQAVGMTNEQLRKMLYCEGLYISVRATVIAAICGSVVGGWFCYLANKVMALKFIVFSLNIWPILLFAVVLIGLQCMVSYCICRSIEKQTLTERLRTE